MRLGFIGAGRMGRPMARRLCEAGHDVRVLARSPEARRTLEGEGLRPADGLAGAAAEADAVVVCVFTDEQVREVCLGGALLDAMPRGSVLVVHTTGSPQTVEAVAKEAASRGIGVVDAPVSGGPHDIAAGRLTVFAGGAEDAVARVRPVLESYGDPVLHVGPLGSGQRVKLLNNALFAAQIGLLADAVRLGGQWGVDESVLLGALPHGSSTSRALAGVVARGSVAGFAASTGGFLGKDMEVLERVSTELGGDLGALDAGLTALAAALNEARRPAGE
ncbi:NAD(P)-dependent oxidoreductase [Actinocorallia sp. B10E7]|uniref:NAD(P)-dependent oxidoreductase n=1 Tax=Actinocorallia sp. B10E7 TaxID=3153558 RepID=UPI00325F1F12